MKATFERVDKIGEKPKEKYKDLCAGDWFIMGAGGEPRVRTQRGHILVPNGSEWDGVTFDEYVVTPIKVHIQYEVL